MHAAAACWDPTPEERVVAGCGPAAGVGKKTGKQPIVNRINKNLYYVIHIECMKMSAVSSTCRSN
jgi:hypothetical protein